MNFYFMGMCLGMGWRTNYLELQDQGRATVLPDLAKFSKKLNVWQEIRVWNFNQLRQFWLLGKIFIAGDSKILNK